MLDHKDTRFTFSLQNRIYEAVGFLNPGEANCLGTEMLQRTAGENGGAIGKEDEEFIIHWINELPVELQPYWLVTQRLYEGNMQRNVSCLAWCTETGRWYRFWDWLGYSWFPRCLVLRRIT